MTGWTELAALGLSMLALTVAALSWWQAKRSADAAVASARAAEQAVELEAARMALEHPAVAFEIERRGSLTFVLRNTGHITVHGIRIVDSRGTQIAVIGRLGPGEVSPLTKSQSSLARMTFLTVQGDGVGAMQVPLPITPAPRGG